VNVVLYAIMNHSNVLQTPLPIRWVAIETLNNHEFSTAGDIWSFGITMWEIFGLCMKIPYYWLECTEILKELEQGKRLARPDYAPREMYYNCYENI